MTLPFLPCLAEAAKIPDLRPPESSLAPTLWERGGGLTGFCLLLGLILALGMWNWYHRRGRYRSRVAAVDVAREALRGLVSVPEDGILAGQAGRVLRVYLTAALPTLPSVELTADEIALALPKSAPWLGEALLRAVTDFLRECDRRKYGWEPVPQAPGAKLVARAADLVERVESARAAEVLRVPPVLSPVPNSKEGR